MPTHNIIDFKTGWQTSKQSFIVDNDAFPVLDNVIVYHGRLVKPSGYNKLGITSIESSGTITLDTSLDPVEFNLADTLLLNAPISHARIIAPSSVNLTVNSTNYTDENGVFTDGTDTFGTINYATGACTLPASRASASVNASLSYYPMLPAVGFHEYSDSFSLVFDTFHAYTVLPRLGISQNFARTSSYLGSNNLLSFTGGSSDLFSFAQTGSYLFCTNGIAGNSTYAGITAVAKGASTVLTVSAETASRFSEDDTVFLCAFSGITELNGLTGNVTATSSNSITLDIDSSSFTDYISGGNIQLLNNSATGDGIKLFFETGFVNFSPPLDSSNTPSYLLGCDHMLFHNNRLICFGTTEGKAGESGTYNPLRIRYSQTNNFLHLRGSLFGQTSSSAGLQAWFEDISTSIGIAGFLDLSEGGRIVYAQILRGYIICGLESGFTRIQSVSSPFALAPFVPFYYRSTLGTSSKNSAVHADDFIVSIGSKGIIGTTFNATRRLDINIINQFERVDYSSRNEHRTTSIRDTKSEIIYINYVDDASGNSFPTKCFAYNYNNNTFASIDQKFTYQGTMTTNTLLSWADISNMTWGELNGIWSQFSDNSFTRSTVGCTSQGAVLFRSDVGNTAFYIPVESFTVNQGDRTTTINSRNHSMVVGDYIRFTELDFEGDNIVRVSSIDNNSFTVDRICTNDVYSGIAFGEFLPKISIRTKAFNSWEEGYRIMLNSASILLSSNENMQVSVDVLSDQGDRSSIDTSVSPSSKGSAFNPNSTRWIRSTYANQEGDSIQLQISFNDEQMRSDITHSSPFELHSIMLDLEDGGFIS